MSAAKNTVAFDQFNASALN